MFEWKPFCDCTTIYIRSKSITGCAGQTSLLWDVSAEDSEDSPESVSDVSFIVYGCNLTALFGQSLRHVFVCDFDLGVSRTGVGELVPCVGALQIAPDARHFCGNVVVAILFSDNLWEIHFTSELKTKNTIYSDVYHVPLVFSFSSINGPAWCEWKSMQY